MVSALPRIPLLLIIAVGVVGCRARPAPSSGTPAASAQPTTSAPASALTVEPVGQVSHCQRALALRLVLPSMATPTPAERDAQKAEFLSACGRLPEPVQRCLTSYAINHRQECQVLDARGQLESALGERVK